MHFDRSLQLSISAFTYVTVLLLGLLWTSADAVEGKLVENWWRDDQIPILPHRPYTPTVKYGDHQSFTLRHVFHRGTNLYPNLHRRLDIDPKRVKEAALGEQLDGDNGIGPYDTTASPALIPRLQSEHRHAEFMNPLMSAAQAYGIPPSFEASDWSLDEVPSPNVTDRGTVINFSLMAGSAYNRDNSDPEWEDTRPPFNLSSDVGWEKDGIRGHVFADADNSTIVIAIKGTTSAVFDGAETTTNDKENDNLFASCCCGQGGSYMWRQVCDCMTSAYTCNETCVTKSLRKPNRYYAASLELYGNITEMYPEANVWVTGHSLGGMVSSLVALTFGIPAVTFEAVPQALAAGRLQLPIPPGYSSAAEARKNAAIYNFGHTADPVYMGACNGATSLCTIGGYAMQSQCHVGTRCVYDVVEDRKWRVSLTTHPIRACIKDVYRTYDTVPKCVPDDECVDCFNWKRYHSNGTETTTTSSSSTTSTSTKTRTSTCKTPGWWGCRDDSTTTTTTSSTTSSSSLSTTTMTTATCKSYGWFGNCLDPVTTTTTSTTAQSIATRTTSSSKSAETCNTPGFFWGCKDNTLTTTTSAATANTITLAPKLTKI